jgi:hypothetical protein
MRLRPVRPALTLSLLALLGLLLAGCSQSGDTGSGGGAPAGQADGSRPDPCALLNAAQLRQLRFSKGQQQQAGDSLGGLSCVWSGYPLAQGPRYTARLLSGPVPGGTPAASIDNMPTSQYTPPGADPRTNCGYLVKVASDRTLLAQFSVTAGAVPGMSHQVACRKAQAAATDMVTSYPSLPAP